MNTGIQYGPNIAMQIYINVSKYCKENVCDYFHGRMDIAFMSCQRQQHPPTNRGIREKFLSRVGKKREEEEEEESDLLLLFNSSLSLFLFWL